MNNPNKKIVNFIKEHHVLTLATSVNNVPYCANCFYVYLEDENIFVLTSEESTKHISDIHKNNYVAGSVVLETSIVGKIQGIQFNGTAYKPDGMLKKIAKKKYKKKYLVAKLMNLNIWIIEINFIKFTDNRLGFGKKLIWKKK